MIFKKLSSSSNSSVVVAFGGIFGFGGTFGLDRSFFTDWDGTMGLGFLLVSISKKSKKSLHHDATRTLESLL